MNMTFFAYPSFVMFAPDTIGGFSGLDFWAWAFGELFVSLKFMALFSMLFGASLLLLTGRLEQLGLPAGRIYYRRLLWLFVIGLIHSYGLWFGDILVPYAMCGLVLYLFRRMSVRWLLILGSVIVLIGVAPQHGYGRFLEYIRGQAEIVAEAGDEATAQQRQWAEIWNEIAPAFNPSEEFVEETAARYRGGYVDIFLARWPEALQMQTIAMFLFVGWRILGLMMIGMALHKNGFFRAQWTHRQYLITAIAGYGLGLPVVAYGIEQAVAHDLDVVHFFVEGALYNYVASVGVALGHAAVVIMVYKSGLLKAFARRLGAVGRTALSNYLLQTLIGTTLFYGYGFGLFGRVNRFALLGMVLAVWALQLWLSTLWLRHFRFGPAEWLWRSLTYKRRQPMRLKAVSQP
jgi:uncharacterized protein